MVRSRFLPSRLSDMRQMDRPLPVTLPWPPGGAAGRGRRAWGCGAGNVVAVSPHVFDLAGAVRHDGRPGGDFCVRSRPGVRGTSACPRNRQGCGCLFLELVSNPKGYHQAKGQNPLDEPDEGELPWKIPRKNDTRVGFRSGRCLRRENPCLVLCLFRRFNQTR